MNLQPQTVDIPLHDIKPLVEVPDQSLYVFLALVATGLAVLGALLYLLWRHIKNKNAYNVRKAYFAELEAVSFDNAKEAAYAITKYGLLFADDSPSTREVYENLVSKLSAYKYRKTVPKIDEETKGYYQIYIEMIDV